MESKFNVNKVCIFVKKEGTTIYRETFLSDTTCPRSLHVPTVIMEKTKNVIKKHGQKGK